MKRGNLLLWAIWSFVGVLALGALVFVLAYENNTDKAARLQRQAESQIQERDFRSAQATLKQIPDGYAGNARPLIDQVNAELEKQRLAGERRKEEEKQRLIAAQQVEEERRRDDERRLKATRADAKERPSQKPEQTSGRDQAKPDIFAVGNRLHNPETPDLSYDAIISRIPGSVKRESYEKYKDSKDKTDKYRKGRVNLLRGFIFEAAVTTEANDYKALNDRNERFLMTSVEGDSNHQADVIFWKDGVIRKRYQLKATLKPGKILSHLKNDKYDDMIIIIHPRVLAEIKQTLSKRKQLGNELDSEMVIFNNAIKSGRLSDEVVPGLPVPSYEKMRDKADHVIRQQMQKARDRWE